MDYIIDNDSKGVVRLLCHTADFQKNSEFREFLEKSFPGIKITANADGTTSITPSEAAYYGEPYSVETFTAYIDKVAARFNLNSANNAKLDIKQDAIAPQLEHGTVANASAGFLGLLYMSMNPTTATEEINKTLKAKLAPYLDKVQEAMATVANQIILQTLHTIGLSHHQEKEKILALLLLLATNGRDAEITKIRSEIPPEIISMLTPELTSPNNINKEAALKEFVTNLTANAVLTPAIILSLNFIAALPSMLDKEKFVQIVLDKYTHDETLEPEGAAIVNTIETLFNQKENLNPMELKKLLSQAAKLVPATMKAAYNAGTEDSLSAASSLLKQALPVPGQFLYSMALKIVAPGTPLYTYYVLALLSTAINNIPSKEIEKINTTVEKLLQALGKKPSSTNPH